VTIWLNRVPDTPMSSQNFFVTILESLLDRLYDQWWPTAKAVRRWRVITALATFRAGLSNIESNSPTLCTIFRIKLPMNLAIIARYRKYLFIATKPPTTSLPIATYFPLHSFSLCTRSWRFPQNSSPGFWAISQNGCFEEVMSGSGTELRQFSSPI